MLERFLLIWLVLSSLVAFLWPPWMRPGLDPFTASKPLLPCLVAVTMFSIGLLLPRDEVLQVLRRWPKVLAGTTLQYTSMPLLAYAMGRLWGLESEYLTGIVLVGCVPGAMASNVLTMNARGHISYSVSLTTLATLLSPLAVPLAFYLLMGARVDVDAWRMSRDLCLTVVLPVILGHATRYLVPKWEGQALRFGARMANLAILWIIAVVVALNRDRLASATLGILGPLLLLNLSGYLVGYGGGTLLRLSDPMRRALTLEIGMQNAGVGTLLAVSFFGSEPATALPPAMYTFGCMLTGTILARRWANRESRV